MLILTLRRACSLFACLASCLAGTAHGGPDYAQGVRTTPWRSPADEQKSFRVPPGFAMQLVASEPDLLKPMNLAFDGRGRLWVTVSQEYPFPAADGKGRDAVLVLDDFDDTGKAKRVTTFAAGLNIPIGLYPTTDGGALVFHVGELRRYHDDDHDGKADRSEVIISGYGRKDTHGMTNAFRRGFDGHIHACHGFSNESHLRGKDGVALALNSGNTYRFRVDGTGLQQYTHGQVNPLGLSFDSSGRLFSADCHSQPIYELLRDAYYPSFGKPDDGLGFAPEITRDSHGSSAIAGVCRYEADVFPEAYRGSIFVGNVMTSRLHHDRLAAFGSTYQARQAEPLVVADDPWFRPVDAILGPDGAVYIADFYNRIIGHYEVDLKHPGRDRTSGRIWRLVYVGEGKAKARPPRVDLDTADTARLVAALAAPNLTVRMLATDQVTDRVGQQAGTALRAALAKPVNAWQRAHAMWCLHRLGMVGDGDVAACLADSDPLVRGHACRLVAEVAGPAAAWIDLVRDRLADADPYVRRCAADALALHPEGRHFAPLVAALEQADKQDTMLRHVLRQAIRNQFRAADAAASAARLRLSPVSASQLLALAEASGTGAAAAFAEEELRLDRLPAADQRRAFALLVKGSDLTHIDDLAAIAQSKLAGDLPAQWDVLTAIDRSLAQRGGKPGPVAQAWAQSLVAKLLDDAPAGAGWSAQPAGKPWPPQNRPCADGVKEAMLWSSFMLGERHQGTMRSAPFALPASLSFFLAGHNGPPGGSPPAVNHIRLVLVKTGEEIARALPPRHDTAQRITWDLAAHRGRQAFIEIVDADGRDAYAWLAAGRFEPAVVANPGPGAGDGAARRAAAVRLAGEWKLSESAKAFAKLAGAAATPADLRAAAIRAAESLGAGLAEPALGALAADPDATEPVRLEAVAALMRRNTPATRALVVQAMRQAPEARQEAIAELLAARAEGAADLLAAVPAGLVSPRVLQARKVAERLRAASLPDLDKALADLTKALPPADERLRKLVAERVATFAKAKPDMARGRAVYTQYCSACHRVGDSGNLVGPQLDAIGVRGPERLAEDILDPNRNVDPAFKHTVVHLKDGDSVSGLHRRTEGKRMVFVNTLGQEVAVNEADVEKLAPSPLSLMPGNFGEVMSRDDFHHLLGFLLLQRGEAKAGK